ncbi:MAG: metallophosphoesterase [Clostridiales bacterium]|nr:metallophosphoesterase [Clostridiales bacterium]
MNKKRILIVSDTHGSREMLKELVEKYRDFDYLIHLGDYSKDLDDINFVGKVISVKGNADREVDGNIEVVAEINQLKFLIVHGHLYDVKFGINKLFYTALEKKVDVVLFGHTHSQFCNKHENILFVNPGSLIAPRHGNRRSYAVMTIENKIIDTKIIEFD